MQSAELMFASKKIIVAGGASGIGYAVAQRALAAGAEVVIASRRGKPDLPISAWITPQQMKACR